DEIHLGQLHHVSTRPDTSDSTRDHRAAVHLWNNDTLPGCRGRRELLMNDTNERVSITLRVPGDWAHPGELVERLPDGFRLTPEPLILPDGTKVEFIPMAPDEQFPGIFQSSCRRPPGDDELAVVACYTVNVGLTGPGGSMESALTMMQAG